MSEEKKDAGHDWSFLTDVPELQRLLAFWNDTAEKETADKNFYKEEAAHFW